MKKVSKQEAFNKFADAYGPDWHRESPYRPYRDEWEPCRANWLTRQRKETQRNTKRAQESRKKTKKSSGSICETCRGC